MVSCIKQHIRPEDVVFRHGSGQFVVVQLGADRVTFGSRCGAHTSARRVSTNWHVGATARSCDRRSGGNARRRSRDRCVNCCGPTADWPTSAMNLGALRRRPLKWGPWPLSTGSESEIRAAADLNWPWGIFGMNLPALRRADVKALFHSRSRTSLSHWRYGTSDHVGHDGIALVAQDDEYAARLTYVLAMTAFEHGDYPLSLELIHRCLLLANASLNRALIAQAHLGLFRVCAESVSPALSVVSRVRKAVANSGDAHSIVDLRLHSRARRRRGIVCRRLAVISLRPIGYSRQLPTLVDGESAIGAIRNRHALRCSIEAVEHARRPSSPPSVSGHRRTHVGGRVNLSHALQALGRWEEARTCIDTVLSENTRILSFEWRHSTAPRTSLLQRANSTGVNGFSVTLRRN